MTTGAGLLRCECSHYRYDHQRWSFLRRWGRCLSAACPCRSFAPIGPDSPQ